jgi:hypothetical protein
MQQRIEWLQEQQLCLHMQQQQHQQQIVTKHQQNMMMSPEILGMMNQHQQSSEGGASTLLGRDRVGCASNYGCPWLVAIYSLHGMGRATFEGTLKATFADYFPQEKECAFANIIL